MKELQKQLKRGGVKLLNGVKNFWEDESGMGTVEVILIIVGGPHRACYRL